MVTKPLLTKFATLLRYLLPNPSNLIFTLLVITCLLWVQSAGARNLISFNNINASTIIPYQGRLIDTRGEPLNQTVSVKFRLYATPNEGTPLWEEEWTGVNNVQVIDGLFNVMLGSLVPIPQTVITTNSNLFLGITVGTDSEMIPRIQLGRVPFATQSLSVPNGSITKEKLTDDISFVSGVEHYHSNDEFSTQSVAPVVVPNAQVTITVGSESQLFITFAADLRSNQNGGVVSASISLDDQNIDIPTIVYVNTPVNVRVTGAQSTMIKVQPGTHSIKLHLRSHTGIATATIGHKSISVLAID